MEPLYHGFIYKLQWKCRADAPFISLVLRRQFDFAVLIDIGDPAQVHQFCDDGWLALVFLEKGHELVIDARHDRLVLTRCQEFVQSLDVPLHPGRKPVDVDLACPWSLHLNIDQNITIA